MVFTQKLKFETKSSLLLLLISLLICAAAPYEDSSSIDDSSSSMSSLQDLAKRSDNPLLQLLTSNNQQLEDKRALSLFAHWKPHYGYKQDFANFPAINTRSDIATRGGSHARPLGQPLRWG